MIEERRNWTRDELILAFYLYLKLPFGKINHSNPEVIQLGKDIGRTANSVALRLANFAHVDPFHQQRGVKGLSGGKKQVEPIWNEFINDKDNLIYEIARIRAAFEHTSIEKLYKIPEDELPKEGKTREQVVKVRVNQSVFRMMILASYENGCCITGITNRDLLIASHIVPWAKDEKNRLNPQNGLCLNPLHDKAFEVGLITITPDYKIKVSPKLKKEIKPEIAQDFFLKYDKQEIILPTKYLPSKDFLEYHNQVRFKQ